MFDKVWNSIWASFVKRPGVEDTQAVSLANASIRERNVIELPVRPAPQPSIKWLRRNLPRFKEYEDAIVESDVRAADSKDRYQFPVR